MSIRIWEDIARQKEQVENQREEILNAFKQRKVADELGQVRAEKLFRPITKLLVKPIAEYGMVPDYDLDDQTRNFKNELPFGEGDFEEPPEEIKEDDDPYADLEPFTEDEMIVPTTESEAGSEKDYEWDELFPSPVPAKEELGQEVLPGAKADDGPPRYSAATKVDKPPKYREPRDDDTSDLASLSKFLKANEQNPDAVMSTKKSKFYGTTVEEARYKVHEIYTDRAKLVLAAGDRRSVIGQKGLGPYEGKSNREMREMIDDFEKGKTKFGSGSLGALINRLSLGISSIFAGNTSLKLREEIRAIANLLYKKGLISSEQKNKVLSLK